MAGEPGAPVRKAAAACLSPRPPPRWLLARAAGAPRLRAGPHAGARGRHAARRGLGRSEARALARCREPGVELVIVDLEPGRGARALARGLRREGRPAAGGGRAGCGAGRGACASWDRYDDEILQNMNSALLVIDADGSIAACNPPAELILGERAESLRGRSLRRWFAGDAPGEDCIARSLSEGIRFRGAESTITRSDGTARSDRRLLRADRRCGRRARRAWWPPSRT